MTELANDPGLRASGTIAEVQHKERGPCLTGASPIKFSDMTVEITGSPLLGEHTDKVLAELVSAPSGLGRCIRPRRFESAGAATGARWRDNSGVRRRRCRWCTGAAADRRSLSLHSDAPARWAAATGTRSRRGVAVSVGPAVRRVPGAAAACRF